MLLLGSARQKFRSAWRNLGPTFNRHDYGYWNMNSSYMILSLVFNIPCNSISVDYLQLGFICKIIFLLLHSKQQRQLIKDLRLQGTCLSFLCLLSKPTVYLSFFSGHVYLNASSLNSKANGTSFNMHIALLAHAQMPARQQQHAHFPPRANFACSN